MCSGHWLFGVLALAFIAACPGGSTRAPADAGAGVKLAWDASPTPDLTYSVYRTATSGGPYTVVGEGLTTTTFTDSTAVPAVSSFYVVKAVDASQRVSTPTNEVRAP